MAGKREKPEGIVSKRRQLEVLQGQGRTVAKAVCQLGLTQQTSYRWGKLWAGMQRPELAQLKELKKNQHLRRAMSDLTLDKLILTEAEKANF